MALTNNGASSTRCCGLLDAMTGDAEGEERPVSRSEISSPLPVREKVRPSTAIGQLAPVANGLALMSFVDFVSREDVRGLSREKAEGGGLWPWKVWGRATMVAARLSFAPPTEGGVLGEVGRSRTLVTWGEASPSLWAPAKRHHPPRPPGALRSARPAAVLPR